MNKENLIKIAEKSPYIPTTNSVIRGAISIIPGIGGLLDHLLFDKSGEIKLNNILKTLEEINVKIRSIDENKISKEWFNSTECVQMFNLLIEKVQFEPNEDKITTLSEIYVKSGLKDFENDPNKFAVMTRVAEMTFTQQELLQIICKIQPIQKVSSGGGGIEYTATAIWISDILTKLKVEEKEARRFWKGELKLDTELGILETFNLIKSLPIGTDEIGYTITALGVLINVYLNRTK